MSFANKVVLVTGASSGVGKGIAECFSKLSANLVITGRNVDNLNKTAQVCYDNSGLKPLCVQADITKEEDIRNIIESTKKTHGRLDVLVNNAGTWIPDNILTMKDNMTSFDSSMKTNVRSHVFLTSLAAPLLIKTKGSITNISSVRALLCSKYTISYGMSKSAIDTFTRYTALELAQKKVNVNSILLAYVRTEIFTRGGGDVEKIQEAAIRAMPTNTAIEAEDVGELIAHLASKAGKNITGSNILFDGGLMLSK